jgi:pimeloyl-ACP methyl ester carboxylesterase
VAAGRAGRPFVLLHGLMGSGALPAGQGLVPALADRGYRVILPDLRGHGDSGRPHDPASYPRDVLADHTLALIEHLGLDDYDLGGYSMGGKLVLRLLARGARPAHAIVGGRALTRSVPRATGLTDTAGCLLPSPTAPRCQPGRQRKPPRTGSGRADARAVGLVLDTFAATGAGDLRTVSAPTLVVVGDQDSRGMSASSLAALLPRGQFALVPGDHITTLGAPEFTAAVAEFLGTSSPPSASR